MSLFDKRNMNSNDKSTITIELPAKIFPYPALRTITESICKTFMDLPEKWIQRIELIVDELSNNAAEHGSKKNDNVKIIFNMGYKNKIVLTVEDQGKPGNKGKINIHAHIKKHKAKGDKDIIENETVRGRGLSHIITKWADNWEIEENKNGGISFHVTILKNKEN